MLCDVARTMKVSFPEKVDVFVLLVIISCYNILLLVFLPTICTVQRSVR
jgi:hypothetical protein